jgi:cytochrome c oxidase cbb3-type subunit 3
MNGRTKHLVLSTSLVTCSLLLAAVAVAQVTTPPPAEPPGAQLQRVPVSGLHIGPPAASMENPYAGDKNAWVEGKALFTSLNCAGCHAPGGGGGMGPALSDKVWIYGGEQQAACHKGRRQDQVFRPTVHRALQSCASLWRRSAASVE